MRKILFFFLMLAACVVQNSFAQNATYSVPIILGRDTVGGATSTKDSVYFMNYLNGTLTKAATPNSCRPVLTHGTGFTTNLASVSFNPRDGKIYFVTTVYSPTRSYIWRWDPLSCPSGGGIDTIKSFNYDIGGIAFTPDGYAWWVEFSNQIVASPRRYYNAKLRRIDFVSSPFKIDSANILDPVSSTNSNVTNSAYYDTLWNVGAGDITITPAGDMYFAFDNKLYQPDWGSYQPTNAANHLTNYCIDTIPIPAGYTDLVGLAYAEGELITGNSPSAGTYRPRNSYRKMGTVTPIPSSAITYTNPRVGPVDMTQIISGIGLAKKLVSATAVTATQYDLVYDIYVKNYGNTPLANVQVKDSLAGINGPGNVTVLSTQIIPASNPLGIHLNPGFTGIGANTNLLTGVDSLKNYPVANNNFTIRVTARVNNLQAGIIYNNSAIGTANGFTGRALRDSSNNGDSPDMNQNDKADDAGEGVPTPFAIAVTPIPNSCAVLNQVLYTQDFGTGTGMTGSIPSVNTQYSGTTVAPIGTNKFSLINSPNVGDPTYWASYADHTGNANGLMMAVNADAPQAIIYRDTLSSSCPGQQYTVQLYASFPGNAAYGVRCAPSGGIVYPRLRMQMRDSATGLLIVAPYTTDSIYANAWTQKGFRYTLPTGTGVKTVILEIFNAAGGGCGNDLLIDDIKFGSCTAFPVVTSSGSLVGCIGGSVTFNSSLVDTTTLPGPKDYKWQWAPTASGPWTDIPSSNVQNYTINPIAAADTGRYYRVLTAAVGNINIATCSYASPANYLAGKSPSVAPTSISSDKGTSICPGISATLSKVGGSLGTNASWKWYTGSCGGTLVGSGTSITVAPSVTTTYFIQAAGDCNTVCQSVTVTIACNIDKDRDGIPDWVESNMPNAFLDANSNGIINAYDPTYSDVTYGAFIDRNGDYINDNFQADGDSDGDGIPNYLDTTFPGRVDTNSDGVDDRFDTDLDGVINMLDLDSDNDGIPDVVEAGGVDAGGDGKIDNFLDADGDGLTDQVDAASLTAYNSGLGLGRPDLDGDGVPNYIDLDSDNDGIPDLVEAGAPDTNNNGKVDVFVDANGDGLADAYINATALLKTGADTNADGRADSYPNRNLDNDAKANPYDMDSDGDGIVDVIEAGLPDANLNGIVDGAMGANGWSTTVSAMAGPLAIRSTDADGKPDYLDIDSDNDGIPDNIEGMSTAGYLLPSTADADGDGLSNTYDNVSGFGGSGIFVYDHDADGTPDYRDLDSDGDGQPDVVEGNDFNLNGISDDLVTLTGSDIDGDGLDNRFDSLNSTLNVKGTSYRMGNGGSFSGDATPGARCPLTKKNVADIDRAWRFVGVVLPVQFLNLTGTLQASKVLLNWTVIATKDVDRFEVERSTNNTSFTKTGVVSQPVKLNEQQGFSYLDDVAAVNSDVIYYRIKVISKNGEVQYSNILLIRKQQSKTPVNIMPNPARDMVSVIFFSEQDADVTIRLVDNLGKVVLMQKQKISKGNNTLQVPGLNRFSNGVYSLQMYVNGEVITQKLVLAN